MNWHVIVRGGISQAIDRCGLSRQGVVRILAAVHVELPAHADVSRLNWDPTDPDFFLYHFGLWDDGSFHIFRFRVNDGTAPGFLFVV